METLKKISTQTLWQILAKISSSLSTLFILGLVAHSFGVEGTGIYTLAATYLGFFYLIADFGVNAYILPQLISGDTPLIWRKLLGFRLLLSLGLMLIALLLLPLLPFSSPTFSLLVRLGIASILPSAVFITASAYFQSAFLYRYVSIATLINSIFAAVFAYWVVSLKLPMQWIIIGNTGGWTLSAVIGLIFVQRTIPLWPIFEVQFMRKILVSSWPISLMLMSNMLYFRVDSFILTSQKSFVDTGIYNLPYTMFQAALVVPTFIMNGFYQLMIKHLEKDTKRFFRELKIATALMAVMGLAGIIATSLIAPVLIPLVTGGSDFDASITVLNILSLGFPAFFLSSLFMWVLVVFRKFKPLLVIYGSALAINIVLNLWLIPRLSYIGAATVTTFCEYLILIFQLTILYKVVYRSS